MNASYHEIRNREELQAILLKGGRISRCAFRSIDFTGFAECCNLSQECRFSHCLFMGCTFAPGMEKQIEKNNLVFSSIDVPYNIFSGKLYTADTLYEGYREGCPESYAECFDSIVYQHYLQTGKRADDIKETLARTLHDHAMSDALHDLLSHYEEKQVVGIMGGHGLLRTEPMYRSVVLISKRLAEAGYLMISGGGPGAMEATHLGAWMAGRNMSDVDMALKVLSEAPSFTHPLWLDTAFTVRRMFPQDEYISVGVPTWLYGHEPATPLATHIAKYFENAIREDGILTLAMGGIIYSPGSAGTMQEIFQDAVQNHYLSFGYSSPMVFLGTDYWENQMPVYKLLTHLVATGKYKNLQLSITDDEDEIVNIIERFKVMRL